MQNNIERESLIRLRESIRPYLTEKRYAHTLSVEHEAAALAAVYMPERENELRAAALLHDIAKNLSCEKQLKYAHDFDIIKKTDRDGGCGVSDALPAPVLHAAAAPGVILTEFAEFSSKDILSAVRYHTTGREKMTVFEAIIYIADCIEPGRSYEEARRLYKRLHDAIDSSDSYEGKLSALEDAVLSSLRHTISRVKEKRFILDRETELAERYFASGGHLVK